MSDNIIGGKLYWKTQANKANKRIAELEAELKEFRDNPAMLGTLKTIDYVRSLEDQLAKARETLSPEMADDFHEWIEDNDNIQPVKDDDGNNNLADMIYSADLHNYIESLTEGKVEEENISNYTFRDHLDVFREMQYSADKSDIDRFMKHLSAIQAEYDSRPSVTARS